jgi:hypothetical protein
MFYFQDLSFSGGYSTHEALLKSCSDAVEGFGGFAWVTTDGIKVLWEDEVFQNLFRNGSYHAVVGIDHVTNTEALEMLSSLNKKHQNFNVQIYYDRRNKGIFHPKFSFFKKKNNNGSLVIGSGNLTVSGLRINKEAFGSLELDKNIYIKTEGYWKKWLEESRGKLKSPDDPEVLDRAKKNTFVRIKSIKKKSRNEILKSINSQIHIFEELQTSIDEDWGFYETNKVLIAEIPKSGNRWKQANFDIKTFKEFFGALTFDSSYRILLRNIKKGGQLSDIESRQNVTVISHNYRFELDAASGLDYPENGKPIGVFIQIATRMFLYHLFMPKDKDHEKFTKWLKINWKGKKDDIKRITTSVKKIEKILEKTVFEKYATK